MALEFYVEQADRSPQSAVANEEIYAGELLSDLGSGADLLTFADAAEGGYGLARYDAQAMAAETEEDVAEAKYDSGQRVQYQPEESDAILRIRTIGDEGAAEPAVDHRSVVGIVDETTGDAPSDAAGRIVEEGYTNGATTYDRATGNFKAIGRAYRPDKQHAAVEGMDDYDNPVRVELFGSVEA